MDSRLVNTRQDVLTRRDKKVIGFFVSLLLFFKTCPFSPFPSKNRIIIITWHHSTQSHQHPQIVKTSTVIPIDIHVPDRWQLKCCSCWLLPFFLEKKFSGIPGLDSTTYTLTVFDIKLYNSKYTKIGVKFIRLHAFFSCFQIVF